MMTDERSMKKRFNDPQWAASMRLRLDYNHAMADFVGEHGLTASQLQALAPGLADLDRQLAADRAGGKLGFMELPYQTEILKEIKQIGKPVLEWCWDLVVLGMGGSALGARALQQALLPPQYNKFPMARRQHRPGLWVLDNIDPDYVFGVLDALDLRRVTFNVISKSGATAETLAQFLWVYQLLKSRLGEEKARERLIITTDPAQGPLRALAEREGLVALAVPANVGGRFSVLSAVGLLPASLVGIDVEELLAGARFMDERLKNTAPERNPAYLLAGLYYLFATAKARNLLVFMPYATPLQGLAHWFCQLWAESLGKKLNRQGQVVHAGSTPVAALGASDQHSQLQLYLEGPQDKLITLVQVEKFQHNLEIPDLYPDLAELGYLGGHSLNELLQSEFAATAFSLVKAGRPSVTLGLPAINAFTVGQLLYFLEVMTVAAGALFGVNPLDQPGVEGGKHTTYGLMGRPGFEAQRREIEEGAPPLEKYRIS